MKQFTHPWVGQAERLACRKRQPGAFAGVARTHFPPACSKHRTAEQESAPVAAVLPLCAGFEERVGTVPLKQVFRRCWAACGAVAVWDSHDAAILAIQNIQFQKKNASGEPPFGHFGGVRF